MLLDLKMQECGGVVSLETCHKVLDALYIAMQHHAPRSEPLRVGHPHLGSDGHDRDDKKVDFGKYKGKTYLQAWLDKDYVKWCHAHSNDQSLPGLKDLTQYFREKASAGAQALMALGEGASSDAPQEKWLLAVLDSGCNRTCHGDHWMKRFCQATSTSLDSYELRGDPSTFNGINGKINSHGIRCIRTGFELEDNAIAVGTLDSVELQDSDAPLLLSMQDQRKLGLTVELSEGGDKVFSKTLGGYLDLKVEPFNGLLGLHLLPSHVAWLGCDEQMEVSSDCSPTSPSSYSEAYLNLDEEVIKPLSRNQKRDLRDKLAEIQTGEQAMWSQLRHQRRPPLPRGCKTFLMEVFAGAAVLSSLASTFGLPISTPVDIKLDGSDLLNPDIRRSIEHEIEKHDPYVVTFAPVCSPWSSWSHVNMAKSEQTRVNILSQRDAWYPTLCWMKRIVEQRLSRGRKVLIENPWSSDLWNTLCMQKLSRGLHNDAETGEVLEVIRTDQCEFGLCEKWRPDLRHLKPTGFMTASKPVKERLSRRCQGGHEHQPLEGSSRTKLAQEWPQELCKQILEGFMDELQERTLHAAFFLEANDENNNDDMHLGTLDGILNEDDLDEGRRAIPARVDAGEIQRQEDMEEIPVPEGLDLVEAEKLRRSKWLKAPRATRLALRRLHNMTGHSSTASMTQLLRTACASPEAIEACRHFACETCRQRQKTLPPNKVKMPSRATFNYEVAVDAFEIKDNAGNRHTVLSAVCVGTLFHQCW